MFAGPAAGLPPLGFARKALVTRVALQASGGPPPRVTRSQQRVDSGEQRDYEVVAEDSMMSGIAPYCVALALLLALPATSSRVVLEWAAPLAGLEASVNGVPAHTAPRDGEGLRWAIDVPDRKREIVREELNDWE